MYITRKEQIKMTENILLNISPLQARRLALAEAGVRSAAFTAQRLERGGGAALYKLEYETGEMRYTCYIDGESGECLGLDFEPIPVDEYPSYYSFPTARAAIA